MSPIRGFGMKKSRGITLLLLVLITLQSAVAAPPNQDVEIPVSTLHAQGPGGDVTVTVGTFEDQDANLAAERISDLIHKDEASAPQGMNLELGDVVEVGSLAQTQSESNGFVARLKGKLGSTAGRVKKRVQLQLGPEAIAKVKRNVLNWTYERAPNTWMWIRIVGNTGVATGAFLFLGHYPFLGAMAAGTSIMIGATGTAKYAADLNDFQNFNRVWKNTEFEKAVEQGRDERDFKMVVLDELHGVVNYSAIELMFTTTVVGLRTGMLLLLTKAHLLNMSVPKIHIGEFLESFAWTMASQMIWDRGAGSIKHFLKEKSLSDVQIERLRLPYMALGSIISVSSFTIMQGVDPTIGKIGLGFLGASGLAITGYFESKIAKVHRARGALRCNELTVNP